MNFKLATRKFAVFLQDKVLTALCHVQKLVAATPPVRYVPYRESGDR